MCRANGPEIKCVKILEFYAMINEISSEFLCERASERVNECQKSLCVYLFVLASLICGWLTTHQRPHTRCRAEDETEEAPTEATAATELAMRHISLRSLQIVLD
jgi:hypothetical protein